MASCTMYVTVWSWMQANVCVCIMFFAGSGQNVPDRSKNQWKIHTDRMKKNRETIFRTYIYTSIYSTLILYRKCTHLLRMIASQSHANDTQEKSGYINVLARSLRLCTLPYLFIPYARRIATIQCMFAEKDAHKWSEPERKKERKTEEKKNVAQKGILYDMICFAQSLAQLTRHAT